MALTDCLFVRVLGELEFGFAMLKITLIFIVDIMAVLSSLVAAPIAKLLVSDTEQVSDCPPRFITKNANHSFAIDPGLFVQDIGIQASLEQFLESCITFTNALYAFLGIKTSPWPLRRL